MAAKVTIIHFQENMATSGSEIFWKTETKIGASVVSRST